MYMQTALSDHKFTALYMYKHIVVTSFNLVYTVNMRKSQCNMRSICDTHNITTSFSLDALTSTLYFYTDNSITLKSLLYPV